MPENTMIINHADNMTMSSKEIADLTGKRHDHVLRDMRTMLISLYGDEAIQAGIPEKDLTEKFFEFMGMGIDSPKLGDQRIQGIKLSRDSRGYIAEIQLDYTHTMTLISGYNVKLRKQIIDKWQELEEQAAKHTLNPANLSRLQLIELAMQAEQERLALEHKVEALEPKAKALDRIADADGSMNPTVAAKNLQVQPKRLFDWLREHHWIYRRPGGSGNVAYQDKIKAGYLTHKVTTVHREDGTEKVVEQVLVTAKGLAKLSQAFAGV